MNQQTVKRAGQADLVDHTVIRLGALAIVVGQAFQVDGQNALNLGAFGHTDGAPPVLKQWSTSPDGRTFLIESIAWTDIQAQLDDLPVTQADAKIGQPGTRLLSSRAWPERPITSGKHGSVQVASASYKPAGYVLDFIMLPNSPLTTSFTAQQTYWITNNYYYGGSVYFAPGCVFKYNNNNYMCLYGLPSFPNTLQSVVFTSKDDNAFGEVLPTSTGSPTPMASQAIWIYYVNFNTTITSARIRYAKRGVEYDQNSGVTATHTVQNSLFEQITGTGNCGIYINIPSGSGVTLSGVQKYNVPTQVQVAAGTYSGIMSDTLFHTVSAFPGIDNSFNDDQAVNPDSMGAIGSSQFFEVINGKVAVFDRSAGTRTSGPNLNTFFQTSDSLSDPRVLYDNNGGTPRWVAAAIDTTSNSILLQVSLSSNPIPLDSTNWKRYVVAISLGGGQFIDYPTLGMDANGLYVSVIIRDSTSKYGFRIQGFHKPEVYTNGSYSPPGLLSVSTTDLDSWCIQPAYNFDTPVNGYAWFVAKGPSSGNSGGLIQYTHYYWSSGSLFWGDTSWQTIADTTPTYRNYYDIPQDGTFAAPQSGGSVGLGGSASRLMMAVIRNGYLWTCQHVGLNSQGTYDGTTKDRTGVQWFELQVSSSGLSYAAKGRIYDSASSSPNWYYFPSLGVDNSGDVVVGFSGSRSNENVGAFFIGGKPINGSMTWMSQPVLVQAGRTAFSNGGRFGDYSATSMDPNDGSFWTVQEFSSYDVQNPLNIWGTWIMRISP